MIRGLKMCIRDRLLSSGKNLADILGELETTNLKKEIRLAVIEIMTADL